MSVRVRLPNPFAALDDRALVARFADGRDQVAFEQLVKRHGGLVFGVCKRAVRDRHLAEDAFQAVFLAFARHPQRALAASSVGGWLFGVARRVGLTARRHEQRREKRELRAIPGRTAEDTVPAEFDELLRVLEEELAVLPEELRAALVACFLEERTQDEAARELGWSLSTLRRRLERGKELLRGRLARRGVSLAVGLLTGAVAAPVRAAVPALASGPPSPQVAALAGAAISGGIRAKVVAACAACALLAGGVAFGLARGPAEPPALVANPDPELVSAPIPRVAEAKQWVTVSGRVVYPKDRALPIPRQVLADNIKAADVWKPFAPLMYEDTLIHPENRGLANVVVYLRPDSDDRKAKFPAGTIHPDLANAKLADRTVLAIRGHFEPRVLAVRAGERIVFDNRLPVPTNVLYRPVHPDGSGHEFNVLIGKGMTHTTKPMPAMFGPDYYTSSIYPWMAGCVWAFDHPYFTVTDADGKFEIPSAPAGQWRLVVWHEAAGYSGGAAGRLGAKMTIPETRTGTLKLAPLTFVSDNWPE